jgi:competence protein ComEC
MHFVIAAAGCLEMYYNDTINVASSITHQYQKDCKLVIVIQEPLSVKQSSYKTTASVEAILVDNKFRKTNGNILLYLEKTPENSKLSYGDILVTNGVLHPVATTGNPAAFNYRQYCYRQGIHFQLYLRAPAFIVTNQHNVNQLRNFIFDSRLHIAAIMDRFVPGKKESGLAQALLIGYKDNLDKDLVQSYSNTGVVHVIAISGLHLGLIYSILILLTNGFNRGRSARLMQLFIVLTGIWLFAILAGASASVVRSAVMFSCIATGKLLSRKLTVYNSLAASAFLLLSYNPFWLWDAGFQLSYAAVLSIIIYQKQVVNLLPLKNKILVGLWKTCAISISAQILTTPVSVYSFHQFPVLFLISNFIAIPLSSTILLIEIALCLVSFIPPLATALGSVTSGLIYLMNISIEYIDRLPYANWHGMQVSEWQCALMYLYIAGLTYWLIEKVKPALLLSLLMLLWFIVLRSASFYEAQNRFELVVYNINRVSATELISRRRSVFVADSALLNNESSLRFNVFPARILYRVKEVMPYTPPKGHSFLLSGGDKLIAIVSAPVFARKKVDIVVVTGSPGGSLANLLQGQIPGIVVFDCSNSRSKIRKWTGECLAAGIHSFSVPDEGAFVMTLN